MKKSKRRAVKSARKPKRATSPRVLKTGALKVVRTVAALRATIAAFRKKGETVALVPTMGALHAGHLELVAAARKRCDRVIVTIFVNPKQFGPREDFSRYPRDLAADRKALATAGADTVFAPEISSMYPAGFATSVAVSGLTERLEGPLRPGHFAGVTTVVSKLLIQAMPDVAVFGEKDYQQLSIIRRMVADLDLPIRIEGVAIVREKDGLALSSRNAYLSAEQRAAAPVLYAHLRKAVSELVAGKPWAGISEAAIRAIRAAGFERVDYFDLCDAATLEPVETADKPARILVAAWIGATRLIDNLAVRKRQ
jgi:pantoate--beta-alanine ligase